MSFSPRFEKYSFRHHNNNLEIARYAKSKRVCCSEFFISGDLYFSFVSASLAYITIPTNKEKQKLPDIKKLTTTSIKTCSNLWIEPYVRHQNGSKWQLNQNHFGDEFIDRQTSWT